MRRSLPLLLPVILALGGCYKVEAPKREGVSSFQVTAGAVFASGTSKPLGVTSACAKRHGGETRVPATERGTIGCPYAIPNGAVDVALVAVALDAMGAPMPTFAGPVSFRAVPGNLVGDYPFRWAQAVNGKAELSRLKVAHLYGPVRFWAEDAPPQPIFDGGLVFTDTRVSPVEPEHRGYATGISGPVYFEEPTIARMQLPDGFDNRSSPFVGQFLSIGKDPSSGELLKQSCPDGLTDTANDGQEVKMVVTGLDPSGFFVTDVSACRPREVVTDSADAVQVRVPEPDGFLPGTFGGLYVYNYSFPEGLYPGDRLFTLAGSVQEFTSTTQLTFPSWTIAEKVRELPTDQWDKWLKLAKPYTLNLRTCGLDNSFLPFVTDATCGQSKKNLKMESLESTLVRVHRARFPEVFQSCDYNSNTQVPFFCESSLVSEGCPTACEGATPYCNPTLKKCVPDNWGWRDCNFNGESEPANDTEERRCLIKCVTSQNDADGGFLGRLCSERSTYNAFGQYIIELAGPGPEEAGLDPTLPARHQEVSLGDTSARPESGYRLGDQLRIWCTADAWVKFGDASVQAVPEGEPKTKLSLLEHTLVDGETTVAFLAVDGGTPGGSCTVAQNPHVRLNLVTKDAVPELQPDCDDDEGHVGAELAEQCRALRTATYDIVGHLRHVQPARPRWLILPRDRDDICCYPGPGHSCPKPLKCCSPELTPERCPQP